jgi:hypothetical protein
MSYDPLSPPNPYRPYVVAIDPSPTFVSSSKSSPRDLLAELDLPTEYLENPEFNSFVSTLLSKGISKYASTFIRQPFEIVKTVMQVQYLPKTGSTPFPHSPTRHRKRPTSFGSDETDDVCYHLSTRRKC